MKTKEYIIKITIRFKAPSMYSEGDLNQSICGLLDNLTNKKELKVTSMSFDNPKEISE